MATSEATSEQKTPVREPFSFADILKENYAWWSGEPTQVEEEDRAYAPQDIVAANPQFSLEQLVQLNYYVVTSKSQDGSCEKEYTPLSPERLELVQDRVPTWFHVDQAVGKEERRPYVKFVTSLSAAKLIAPFLDQYMVVIFANGETLLNQRADSELEPSPEAHRIPLRRILLQTNDQTTEAEVAHLDLYGWFPDELGTALLSYPKPKSPEAANMAVMEVIDPQWCGNGANFLNNVLAAIRKATEKIPAPEISYVPYTESKTFDDILRRNCDRWRNPDKWQIYAGNYSVQAILREAPQLSKYDLMELNCYVVLIDSQDGTCDTEFFPIHPDFVQYLDQNGDIPPNFTGLSVYGIHQQRPLLQFFTSEQLASSLYNLLSKYAVIICTTERAMYNREAKNNFINRGVPYMRTLLAAVDVAPGATPTEAQLQNAPRAIAIDRSVFSQCVLQEYLPMLGWSLHLADAANVAVMTIIDPTWCANGQILLEDVLNAIREVSFQDTSSEER